MGTVTYLDTPNISMPEAMPANWEMMVATFPISRHTIAKAVMRMPKRSRMRAAKPLPVTAPILPAVTCTTISSTHMMGKAHRVLYPNRAPTWL